MNPIKKIEEFVTNLDMTGEVVSLSNDGINTTLVLDCVYALSVGRLIDIDGTDYTLLDVDYYSLSVTVSGVIPSASTFSAKPLTFKVGSQYQVNEELSFFDEAEVFPLFFLNVPYTEDSIDADSGYSSVTRQSVVICDVANYRDWTTVDYQEKAEQLRAFSNYVYKQMQGINNTDNVTRTNRTVYFKYGELSGRNVPENSVFNDRLTGVLMGVRIPFINCRNC